MQHNIFTKAINEFKELGQKIPNVEKLVLRGTCPNQDDLVIGWSDLDFSIILKSIDKDNIPELRKLVRYLKKSNDFKISVTVVTINDFNSDYHYHGMKPLYYACEVKEGRSFRSNRQVSLPPYFKENLFLYDCLVNLVYLIHDIRNGYFGCGDSIDEKSLHTHHLVKRSNFIFKNAFYIMDKKISHDDLIAKAHLYFPAISNDFFYYMKNMKYKWKDILKDQKMIERIMHHSFEQVNYIYETTLEKVIKAEMGI